MTGNEFIDAYKAAFNRDQPPEDQIAALNAYSDMLEREGLSPEVKTVWPEDPDAEVSVYHEVREELKAAQERLERGG